MTTKWQEVEGVYGDGRWHLYFHGVEDDDSFSRHLLLQFLNELKILQYHKCYDAIYEIVVKDKND